jgi:hypothetical protein
MGVTDLTPTLQWGGSSNGQPQLPPGYGGSSSWLDYLASMFNPVSSAQASVLHPDLNNSQAVQQPLGPPPSNDSVTMAPPGQGALAQARGVANPPFPDQSAQGSILPQARGMAVPPDTSSLLPQARGVAVQPGPMAPGNSILQPGADRGVVPGATAAPRAAPMGGGNPNFGTVQYQNPNSIGNRAPIYTTGNLGGLFGGMFNRGAAPGAGAPQGTPAQTPRPTVPGPMAASQGGNWAGTPDFSNLDDDIFDQPGAGPTMRRRGSSPGALAAASLKQRYG